ncbi:MAG: ABATE domain-containing protein [Anaerolineales bacterium]|nr:ABATE domain-containing protein [Anaerolineales bacterium]
MGHFNAEEPPLNLCLEFTNTVDWHGSQHPEERLITYRDLIAWATEHGLVEKDESNQLLIAAGTRQDEAATALARARELREAIYLIFLAGIEGQPPDPSDLETLNTALARAVQGSRLIASESGYTWGWADPTASLDGLLSPIARSAGALLTSEKRERVGQCEDDRGCGYLFLDTSKNRSRRWCKMGDCGNRAKQKRYQKRSRKNSSEIA